jgi:CzcA family heavy metal efflux pump
MMRWIVSTSIRFRFLVVALGGAMMLFGVTQLRDMPVDVFPEFAPPKVEIQTVTLGLTPEETETLVTVPLEQALAGIPALDVLRSRSVGQLSQIELIFDPGTDLIRSRQLVQERLQSVAPNLPTWAAPPIMLQPLSSTSRVMKIGISSKDVSVIDQSMTAYWKIRARLLRVPGVANAVIWGERIDMKVVQVAPQLLEAKGITLDEVMESTGDALDAGILKYTSGSVVGKGGFIDTANQRLNVHHVLPVLEPAELAEVVVAKRGGETIRIGDVARVVKDHQALIGDAVIDGGPGLMMIVEKLPWGNTLDVTQGVEDAIDQMRPGLPGFDIDTTIFRPATFVQEALNNLGASLVLGSVLVVVVLALFLFDWRSALISVITIPMSLIAAGLVLYARGATINTMVLAGFVIALGAIVDDAIVDVENIVRRLRLAAAQGSQQSKASIILESSLEVRGAVVYASFIEALALLPVFFLEGLTGAFFRPLAFSYALAVLVSLVVALVMTPALSMILFSRAKLRRAEGPLVRWLQAGYGRLLQPIVRNPLPAFAVAGLIAAAGFVVVPRLGQELLPSFKERDFLMHWVTKPGTSLEEEVRITTASAKELQAIPGVRNFGAHIGQALVSDEPVGPEFGENWISIDPKAPYDETLARIQSVVDGYPGVRRDLQTYLKERIREVLTGAGEAVVVRIYGDDLDVLRAKAAEVEELMLGVDGLTEQHAEQLTEVPQVTVEVDLEAAERYGLKPGDVRRAASTLIAGEEVADIFRGGKAYDVQVWSIPEARQSLDDIRDLRIDTPTGQRVRLADVAAVEVHTTPNAIRHQDLFRRIDVLANPDGSRDLGSVAHEVQDRLDEVEFPLGYHAELLGEYKERQTAQDRLRAFSLITAAGIFVLLMVVFKRFRLALLTFLSLPTALVGGAVAVYWFGGIISLGSLVGFFTVLGIVTRNGIMLISHYQHLEDEEGVPFGPELVIQGAKERLAPILMTALTTGLALVPLLLAGNIAGQEIEYPMAIVITGGLICSTLLNLFVVPSLYLFLGKSRKEKRALGMAPG